jgi:hypothetical protein
LVTIQFQFRLIIVPIFRDPVFAGGGAKSPHFRKVGGV